MMPSTAHSGALRYGEKPIKPPPDRNLPKMYLIGGFRCGLSMMGIREGFERTHAIRYWPSRGSIAEHRERDSAFLDYEIESVGMPDSRWDTEDEFRAALMSSIERDKPELLLWWMPKDDCPRDLIVEIRNRFPFCKTVCHHEDDPYNLFAGLRYEQGFEFGVTCCEESADHLTDSGTPTICLYPPPYSLHKRAGGLNQHERCDVAVTFFTLYGDTIGNVTLSQICTRREAVEAVLPLGRVHVYGGMGVVTSNPLSGPVAEQSALPGVHRSCFRGFRYCTELPSVYASAKISLNHHAFSHSRGYLNMRDMDIAGSGGFLLTDHVIGIDKLFDVGKEIDTYASVDELVDKAKWWMSDKADPVAAGKAAQRRVFENYSAEHYARKLLAFTGLRHGDTTR